MSVFTIIIRLPELHTSISPYFSIVNEHQKYGGVIREQNYLHDACQTQRNISSGVMKQNSRSTFSPFTVMVDLHVVVINLGSSQKSDLTHAGCI